MLRNFHKLHLQSQATKLILFDLGSSFISIVQPLELEHSSVIGGNLDLMKGLLDVGDDSNGITSKLDNCIKEMWNQVRAFL